MLLALAKFGSDSSSQGQFVPVKNKYRIFVAGHFRRKKFRHTAIKLCCAAICYRLKFNHGDIATSVSSLYNKFPFNQLFVLQWFQYRFNSISCVKRLDTLISFFTLMVFYLLICLLNSYSQKRKELGLCFVRNRSACQCERTT